MINPWEDESNLYWTNPENGLEWFVDVNTTKYCSSDTVSNLPKLKAVCFFVVKNENGVRKPISRVLIDVVTNSILADETSLEAMGAKIDILRLALQGENR